MKRLITMWKNIKKNNRHINEIEYSEIKLNDYIIIDVRSKREFNENHINGAINIPLIEIKKIKKIIPDKNRKILVYCQSGVRSKKAIEILSVLEYTQLFNLKGGIENI